MRYYSEDVFVKNGGVETINHVDWYTTNGIVHFRYNGGSLILENEKASSGEDNE